MPSGSDAIAQIRSALGSLVASERRVAEVVLADPKAVVRMTASQLGALAQTSATTVIRFSRNVGFSGFQELAISLAMARGSEPPARLELGDSPTPEAVLASVAAIAERAVSACASTVMPASLGGAVSAIAEAGHVLCLGAGLSLATAQDLSVRLTHLGISSDAPSDRHVQRLRAMHLGAGDVCFVVLQGGTYPPIVEAARNAKASGAHVVALTPFEGTPLAEAATTTLLTGADSVHSLMDAWPVRLQFMMVIDALMVALMHTDKEHYATVLRDISDIIEQDNL